MTDTIIPPQHTPGPWVLSNTVHSDRKNIFNHGETTAYHVGTIVSGSKKDLPIFRANARLIAAAPELLVEGEWLLWAADMLLSCVDSGQRITDDDWDRLQEAASAFCKVAEQARGEV